MPPKPQSRVSAVQCSLWDEIVAEWFSALDGQRTLEMFRPSDQDFSHSF